LTETQKSKSLTVTGQTCTLTVRAPGYDPGALLPGEWTPSMPVGVWSWEKQSLP